MPSVEKDIPFPEKRRKMKYPWLEMNVGDSFQIDCSIAVARINAASASERYKKNFVARMYKGKPRIWRMK